MPKHSPEETALRERLTAWLRYFRAYYDAEDKTDAAFAERVGYSAQAISMYFTRARPGPGMDILPLMRERLHADLNKVVMRGPTPDEMDSARNAAVDEQPPARRRRPTGSGE